MEITMNSDDLIVSKTDLKGRITYGNEAFIRISGYNESELLHQPHNILRHKSMPKLIFRLLWERIQNKRAINAYVKNSTKGQDHYWVFANVTASLDKDEKIIGYYSVRRKPSEKAVKTMESLYMELIQAEQQGGVEASKRLLEKTLKKAGVSYDEYIISLQE